MRRCHQISVALFLDECQEFDCTPVQFAVLSTLCESGEQDQITLGGAAALDRTTIAGVVKKLEQRKLVRRKQSGKDRRSKLVAITAKGKRFVEQVSPGMNRAQDRTIAPLDRKEAVELIRLLKKLAEENNTQSRAPMKSSTKTSRT